MSSGNKKKVISNKGQASLAAVKTLFTFYLLPFTFGTEFQYV